MKIEIGIPISDTQVICGQASMVPVAMIPEIISLCQTFSKAAGMQVLFREVDSGAGCLFDKGVKKPLVPVRRINGS